MPGVAVSAGGQRENVGIGIEPTELRGVRLNVAVNAHARLVLDSRARDELEFGTAPQTGAKYFEQEVATLAGEVSADEEDSRKLVVAVSGGEPAEVDSRRNHGHVVLVAAVVLDERRAWSSWTRRRSPPLGQIPDGRGIVWSIRPRGSLV
jgi:hypothetical protein